MTTPKCISSAIPIEPIIAVTSAQQIVVILAIELVGSKPTGHRVVPVAAINQVRTGTSDDLIIAGISGERVEDTAVIAYLVVPIVPGKHIIAQIRRDGVIASAAKDLIVSATGVDPIIAATSIDLIITVIPIDRIGSGVTCDYILLCSTHEHISAIPTGNGIKAANSIDRVIAIASREPIIIRTPGQHVCSILAVEPIVPPRGG